MSYIYLYSKPNLSYLRSMSAFIQYLKKVLTDKWKLTLLLYATALALLVLLLKVIEYKYMVRQLRIEIYIGLVATLFTGLGIWIGFQLLFRRKQTPVDNTTSIKLTTIDKLGISKREYEVLELMAKGLSNQQIADSLFISLPTVKTHSSNIFLKLDVARRTQAIHKAKTLGIIL